MPEPTAAAPPAPNAAAAPAPATAPRRRRWPRRLLLVALLAVAAEQTWRHTYDYFLPEKFAVVEPGRLYRGAWQKEIPMRAIVRDHHIKTIVALAHQPDSAMATEEHALAARLGCRWIHLPIVDNRSIHEQKELFDRLEEAAATLADPANQPVYFHCHHGINRASMVQMAYRMLYCGWTLDEATAEIARTVGLREVDKGPDYRHMAAFYRVRVLPRRAAAPPADTATAATPPAAAVR